MCRRDYGVSWGTGDTCGIGDTCGTGLPLSPYPGMLGDTSGISYGDAYGDTYGDAFGDGTKSGMPLLPLFTPVQPVNNTASKQMINNVANVFLIFFASFKFSIRICAHFIDKYALLTGKQLSVSTPACNVVCRPKWKIAYQIDWRLFDFLFKISEIFRIKELR